LWEEGKKGGLKGGGRGFQAAFGVKRRAKHFSGCLLLRFQAA